MASRPGPTPRAISSATSARTAGGVAGFGAQIVPHVNIGFSIDQSHTKIDVPLALQTATLDLTQLGFTAAVDKGPWTWAIALVHGFGNIGSSRDTGLGFATASYGARIDGALTEIDYYWNHRAEPHRAQGRAGMGALHDRLAAGGRRLRSRDGDRRDLRADARA